ncbi:MAG TPA: hypothetical protein VIL33_03340 [Rhodothermia bacterium]
MFGSWISDVQRALLKLFPADRAYSAEDLKSPQMPTAVGHFLRHALRRRAERIEFSVETEWFDPDAPDVQSALESYRQALTSTARYPQAAWKASLERGVQFVISHLVNPASGLVAFVFGDSTDPVPVARVTERLEYFGAQPELGKAVLGILAKKSVKEIGPEDLRAAVLKADRTLVKGFAPSDWVIHLEPLYEIAGVLRENENSLAALPTDLLKAFFEQKNCEDIVSRLEAVESVKGVHTLTADVLRRAAGEKPEPPAEEPAEENEVPVPVTRVVRNDIHRDEGASAVPRWMRFAAGGKPDETISTPTARGSSVPPLRVDDPSAEDEEGFEVPGKIGQRAPVPDDLEIATSGDGVESSEAAASSSAEGSGNVPRWTQFRGMSTPTPAGPPDVNPIEERVLGRLNAVQRAWYINHLFAGDRSRWAVVMELLAGAGDWEGASEIIATEVFERHGVDIYSRPAVDFTNAVEARFR